ncbi:FRG domain-containing protein [Phenylobacterium sp.]|uniref:FRG domain-containing protein n=1 Tax=Phenylobacterium sp. TaxID=1871053 RepID=UPI003BAB4DD9
MRKLKAAPPAPRRSLTDFIEAFATYARSSTELKCYRGQRNVTWDNVAGIYRPDLRELGKNEKRAIRDIVSVHPQEFSSDETMFDKLVRMQHFGLPTRLLDVTLNPLVALYFATEPDPSGVETDGAVTAFSVPAEREKYFDSDCVSCLSNLANLTQPEKDAIVSLRDTRPPGSTLKNYRKAFNKNETLQRLHQFIRAEKPYFLPIINPVDLFKPYYVHPKMSNRRILSQAGAFIIYGLPPTRSIKFAHVIVETKFAISKDDKVQLRADLDNLGINESTLFPEIDRAAKRIKDRYAGA